MFFNTYPIKSFQSQLIKVWKICHGSQQTVKTTTREIIILIDLFLLAIVASSLAGPKVVFFLKFKVVRVIRLILLTLFSAAIFKNGVSNRFCSQVTVRLLWGFVFERGVVVKHDAVIPINNYLYGMPHINSRDEFKLEFSGSCEPEL